MNFKSNFSNFSDGADLVLGFTQKLLRSISSATGVEEVYVIIFFGVMFAALLYLYFGKHKKRKDNHSWRIKQGDKVIERVQGMVQNGEGGKAVSYLRSKSVDPFVFEELLLTCFKSRGVRIKRNKRYTGDGGIDGVVWINRKKVLIQAKLYSGHINPKHVEELAELCAGKKALGLFIHSGRTGDMSRDIAKDTGVHILSGQHLLDLITGKPIKVFAQSKHEAVL